MKPTLLSVGRSRYFAALAGGAFLAAGVLLPIWSTPRVVAAQAAPPARETTRMPDGTEFPLWERPLQFTKTYYVNGNAANASDTGPGTQQQPFRTIGKAADVLQPGERVVIAEGVYREVVQPRRGGTGPEQMISYEAAEGAKVVIRGSEVLNKVYDNMFFNTGESAVNFENEHNTADGNEYANVPGGYLRVLRPGRPELLDVAAARDYYGWEKNGGTGSMQLSLDPETLQLTLATNGEVPKVEVFNPASITTDYFGVSTGETRVPGPFADLSQPIAKSIDPRGKH